MRFWRCGLYRIPRPNPRFGYENRYWMMCVRAFGIQFEFYYGKRQP